MPLSYFHQPTADSEPVEALAVHEDQAAKGTDTGPCAMSIHGVTEADLASMSYTHQDLLAIQHLKNGGDILSVGRSSTPEPMNKNPQLYPGMFPWLFPYGYGGFGNSKIKVKISHKAHIRWMLERWEIWTVRNYSSATSKSSSGVYKRLDGVCAPNVLEDV